MGGKCKFNKNWSTTYKWVEAVDADPQSAFCKLCKSLFKIYSKDEGTLARPTNSDKLKHKLDKISR